MKAIFRNMAFGALTIGVTAFAAVAAQAQDLTIIAVTHGQASDPFWSVVKNGMMQAGKDMNVKVDYRAPETFDMVQMGQLIEAAANQNPAGIVISDPDPDALGPAIQKAVAAGIPVISMNSGISAAEKLGIKLHVGQDEGPAGIKVGEKLKSLGLKHVLCVNQEVGNAALDQRCAGTEKGFGGKVTVLPTTTDPAETQSKIQAALTSDPSIDVILGLSAPLVGEPAVAVVEKMGLGDKVKVASYDLSAGFLKDVADGKALFAVDQQPYLQGYLPVTFLALNARYGTIPAGNVASGPSFVEKAAASAVIEKSSQGIR
ncbi:sugar ABC transporter substrate-binding protein [Rhizobium hainanense]|uniref:Monosaccharide ABC transporter substrate-binding protein, CUT2 family n=1 Tax=Rhizobium hainanense TaxID=52131 RepID=A0A1C3WGR6_9HYPH|nr:sugar ABC transporter substrate-binding protein [Rhizobium hainanense]SCB39118.1 monosaccharide ABC transporter substrate-binding protein, CUT2 family [Rhizobium hainanense]